MDIVLVSSVRLNYNCYDIPAWCSGLWLESKAQSRMHTDHDRPLYEGWQGVQGQFPTLALDQASTLTFLEGKCSRRACKSSALTTSTLHRGSWPIGLGLWDFCPFSQSDCRLCAFLLHPIFAFFGSQHGMCEYNSERAEVCRCPLMKSCQKFLQPEVIVQSSSKPFWLCALEA